MDRTAFYEYVVNETRDLPAMDRHERPFAVGAILISLVEGDLEALERLLDDVVPKVVIADTYLWIVDNAKEIREDWKRIETIHGSGSLLNLELIDTRDSFPQ